MREYRFPPTREQDLDSLFRGNDGYNRTDCQRALFLAISFGIWSYSFSGGLRRLVVRTPEFFHLREGIPIGQNKEFFDSLLSVTALFLLRRTKASSG